MNALETWLYRLLALALPSMLLGCSGELAASFASQDPTYGVSPQALTIARGSSAQLALDVVCPADLLVSGHPPLYTCVSSSYEITGIDGSRVTVDDHAITFGKVGGFIGARTPGNALGDYFTGNVTLRIEALPNAQLGSFTMVVDFGGMTNVVVTIVDALPDTFNLGVTTTGNGRVSAVAGGIDCGSQCSASLPTGTPVQLTASPGPGQALLGWTGCDSASGLSCTVQMSADRNVGASFSAALKLEVSVTGDGRVTGGAAGIDCRAASGVCSAQLATGATATLQAVADAGQRLAAWGGDCSGPDLAQNLVMARALHCSATFEADPDRVRLTVAVSGPGRVVSQPAGIDCGVTCGQDFAPGTVVTLTAEPQPGQAVHWAGAAGCTGSALVVTLTLAGDGQCGATFAPVAAINEWRPLGDAPAVAAVVDHPAIVADAAGVPTLAYVIEIAEFRQVVVKRLDGQAWVTLGGGPIDGGLTSAYAPALALDSAGQPVVAWFDSAAHIRVRRWDGGRWVVLSDALAVTPGAITSVPQIAVHGDTLVAAWNEFQGTTARLALQRYDLASGGPWTGGYVPGLSSANELDLRMALQSDGRATLLVQRRGSGVGGELPLRALRETATGWDTPCGDLGTATGLGSSHQILGYGVQYAADGSLIAAEAGADFDRINAWRCDGSAWLPWGPDSGAVLRVDNVQAYLQAMALSGGSTALLAVQVNTGYLLGTRIHAFRAGAEGFVAVGPVLDVAQPGRTSTLAVAAAGANSPLVVFGVDDGPNQGLQTYRFHP
jgi:hypothetical protein